MGAPAGSATILGCQINANEAVSGEVDLGGFQIIALEVPTGFNGTQITVQTRSDVNTKATVNPVPVTWRNLYDSTGTEVTLTVAANRIVGVVGNNKDAIAPCRWLRFRSGTSAAPVNQNPTLQLNVICNTI